MTYTHPILLSLLLVAGIARAEEASHAPAAPVVPAVPKAPAVRPAAVPGAAPAAGMTDPGLAALTPEERKTYLDSQRALQNSPEIKAAYAEAKAAQEALTKAVAKVREVRANALKAQPPEVAALEAKVLKARQDWYAKNRATSLPGQSRPATPRPAVPTVPAARPAVPAPVAPAPATPAAQ